MTYVRVRGPLQSLDRSRDIDETNRLVLLPDGEEEHSAFGALPTNTDRSKERQSLYANKAPSAVDTDMDVAEFWCLWSIGVCGHP